MTRPTRIEQDRRWMQVDKGQEGRSAQGWSTEPGSAEDDGLPPWKPLTREEAQALAARTQTVSPWRVVAAQVAVGILSALVWGGVVWFRMHGNLPDPTAAAAAAAGSALWGSIAIALPAALMVRGMGRLPPSQPQAMVAGFLFWELVKIGLSVGLLVGAAVAFRWLHWPALLVTLVICTKMNWLALLRRGPRRTTVVE